MKKIKIYSLLLLVLSPFLSLFGEKLMADQAADGPNIAISSSAPIESKGQVVLNVTVSASSGQLTKPGQLKVRIPKSIVGRKAELAEVKVNEPFSLPESNVVDEDDQDYILNINYTPFDGNTAFGASLSIHFAAKYYTQNTPGIPAEANFRAELYQDGQKLAENHSISAVTPGGKPHYQLLNKWSNRASKKIDNKKVWQLSKNNPENNVFLVSVNYSSETHQAVTLKDEFDPAVGLTDPINFIPDRQLVKPANKTPFQGIQVAKVVERNADGQPIKYQLVTQEFADNNRITVTGNTFSINFGDLTQQDAYLVMYGQKVLDNQTSAAFGVKENNAQLLSGDQQIAKYTAYMGIDETEFQSVLLTKSVVEEHVTPTSGTIKYNINIRAKDEVVGAGTVIKDPLVSTLTYANQYQTDANYFGAPVVDQASNTLEFTLLKDLNPGESTDIEFTANYNNPNGTAKDVIQNRASMIYKGNTIFSNVVVSPLGGKIKVIKVDKQNKNYKLSGAEFKLLDNQGQVVIPSLVTDDAGQVTTDYIAPGEYQLVETKAPEGYELDATPINVSLAKGQDVAEVEVTNQRILDPFRITKEIKSGAQGPEMPMRGEIISNDITYQGKVFVPSNKQTVEDFTIIDKLDSRTQYVAMRVFDGAKDVTDQFTITYTNLEVRAVCTNVDLVDRELHYEIDVKFLGDIAETFTPDINNVAVLERRAIEDVAREILHVTSQTESEMTTITPKKPVEEPVVPTPPVVEQPQEPAQPQQPVVAPTPKPGVATATATNVALITTLIIGCACLLVVRKRK